MSTLTVTAVPCPNDAAADLEAMTLPLCSQHAAVLQAWVPATGPNVLDEPSSLPLMLIGVATLAAYRGITKTFGVQRTAKPFARSRQATVKPRRRAA
jgi:hypothetical protein